MTKIALYGRSGSGKSLISRLLVDQYGFERYSSGELCRELSRALFGNEDRANLNLLSEKVREIDPHLWIAAALRRATGDRIVFESVRYPEDLDYLQPAGFAIWLVDCPETLCQQRLHQRGQKFSAADLSHTMEEALGNDFPFDARIDNGDRALEEVVADIGRALGEPIWPNV